MRKSSPLLIMLFSCIFLACGSNSDDRRIDDSATVQFESKLKINSAYRIKRDNTYVDLNTGKKLALSMDSVNNVIIDNATSFPVPFFIDLETKDTIDQHGRIVNNAILPGENGLWKLDEGKLKKIK